MGMEKDLTLGGEYMMHYTDDVLLSCTLETCMVLLTNVTPINSIKIIVLCSHTIHLNLLSILGYILYKILILD